MPVCSPGLHVASVCMHVCTSVCMYVCCGDHIIACSLTDS